MPCFKSEKQRKFMGARGLLSKSNIAKNKANNYSLCYLTNEELRESEKWKHAEYVAEKEREEFKRKQFVKEDNERKEHELLKRNLNRASSMGYLTKKDLMEAYELGLVNKHTYSRMLRHTK